MRDVCTFFFLVTAFFAWADSWDDFLVEGGGDGRDSEEDVNPLFSGSFHYESELSSNSCRCCFAWDFKIFIVEPH